MEQILKTVIILFSIEACVSSKNNTTIYACVGENVTLSCPPAGVNKTVSWFRKNVSKNPITTLYGGTKGKGANLQPNTEVNVNIEKGEFNLTIMNLTKADNGTYQCLHDMNFTSWLFHLTIEDPDYEYNNSGSQSEGNNISCTSNVSEYKTVNFTTNMSNYGSWTLPELKKELKTRGARVSAIEKYESITKLETVKCGLFVSKMHPFLAASPDGLTENNTLLEIKCPYTARNELITPKSVPYLSEVNGELILDPKHDYYYQIQGQLFCTGKQTCDFFVYTHEDHKLITIQRNDRSFIVEMKGSLTSFYKKYFKQVVLDKFMYNSYDKYSW